MSLPKQPNNCSCGPECDKCACGCHTKKVTVYDGDKDVTAQCQPYFVITELVSGDTSVKLAYPIKIDC